MLENCKLILNSLASWEDLYWAVEIIYQFHEGRQSIFTVDCYCLLLVSTAKTADVDVCTFSTNIINPIITNDITLTLSSFC